MNPFFVPKQALDRLRADAEQPGLEQGSALRRLSAVHRLHTLVGLRAANHGWLGACFSAMEILTVLHHAIVGDPRLPLTSRHSLVVSKGHAAMAQFAVLAGMGVIPLEKLAGYKSLNGLPAHSDRTVLGVDADSGSLGMGLSKGIGIARAHRAAGRPFRSYVLLGDGELQEGQVFESLLTLKQWKLRNCIPIIDRNRLQSDSQTRDIKDADDWQAVCQGIGLKVLSCDGHDPEDLLRVFALSEQATRPTVIFAETVKGAGTTITAMSRTIERRKGIWHGAIPSVSEALKMEHELIATINDAEVSEVWQAFRVKDLREQAPDFMPDRKLVAESHANGESVMAPGNVSNSSALPSQGTCEKNMPVRMSSKDVVSRHTLEGLSTEEAWGEALAEVIPKTGDVYVLDADLEKTCQLRSVARECPERFLEVGISEQDMVSIAAGLGLSGNIGIVNTLAAFLRRAFDQIQAAAIEGIPMIVVGHYAGVDFFSDGKSHQSLNDVAMMRAIPGIQVFEPLTAQETRDILNVLLAEFRADLRANRRSSLAYVRLHRSSASVPLTLPHPFSLGSPYILASAAGTRPPRLFVTSPHLAVTALEARTLLATDDIDLEVVGLSFYGDADRRLKKLLLEAGRVFSLESHLRHGGLADLLASMAQVGVVRIGVPKIGGSTRTLDDMIGQYDLTAASVAKTVAKAWRCPDGWNPSRSAVSDQRNEGKIR